MSKNRDDPPPGQGERPPSEEEMSNREMERPSRSCEIMSLGITPTGRAIGTLDRDFSLFTRAPNPPADDDKTLDWLLEMESRLGKIVEAELMVADIGGGAVSPPTIAASSPTGGVPSLQPRPPPATPSTSGSNPRGHDGRTQTKAQYVPKATKPTANTAVAKPTGPSTSSKPSGRRPFLRTSTSGVSDDDEDFLPLETAERKEKKPKEKKSEDGEKEKKESEDMLDLF